MKVLAHDGHTRVAAGVKTQHSLKNNKKIAHSGTATVGFLAFGQNPLVLEPAHPLK